jgi:hypothetical protein
MAIERRLRNGVSSQRNFIRDGRIGERCGDADIRASADHRPGRMRERWEVEDRGVH